MMQSPVVIGEEWVCLATRLSLMATHVRPGRGLYKQGKTTFTCT